MATNVTAEQLNGVYFTKGNVDIHYGCCDSALAQETSFISSTNESLSLSELSKALSVTEHHKSHGLKGCVTHLYPLYILEYIQSDIFQRADESLVSLIIYVLKYLHT